MTSTECIKCHCLFDASVMPSVLVDTCPWCLGWRTQEDYDRAYEESRRRRQSADDKAARFDLFNLIELCWILVLIDHTRSRINVLMEKTRLPRFT